MIVQKNGEQFTVNTTNKEIDVILYFPKLADKGLESVGTGSMRDKGKELIDQAREVQLKKEPISLKNIDVSNYVNNKNQKDLQNFLSTRHKSQSGETHSSITDPYLKYSLTLPHNGLGKSMTFNNNPMDSNWFKTLIDSDFREDKLSEANQQKEFNKALAEQEVIKQWESKKEIFPNVLWNEDKKEGIKKVIAEYKEEKLGVISENNTLENKLRQAIDNPKYSDPTFERLFSNWSAVGFKETAGKTDYSEINLGILDLMAERFSANKDKYKKGNSKKHLDREQILWALFRHVKKMVQPIEGDEENFTQHLAAVLTNCSILLDQLELEK